ncbi:ICEBs1 excisionase [Shouchella clausii]|uniref:ICEBs1 excisionase n=1 Tax=Shouchella clausii TaxID=79880 RepID=UPI0026F453D3|nr:ICEBs1 excisionase [Shouchella clausii]MDO7284702.1 ICEBs1 excisionase [Shouchella clausii]MDO7304797.1 ICEBs1 excisionase [Shouchella clausii]
MYEFLTPTDLEKILKVKKAKAYEIIRTLNAEMKKEGYMVIPGKVSREKFEERYIYKNKNKAEVG